MESKGKQIEKESRKIKKPTAANNRMFCLRKPKILNCHDGRRVSY
ncbi:hypothetical protein DOY81_005386 [Sarcophaga bullata]|nr:hypothetical protein DOY81_005386 [Sarcophaga bullata]